MHQSFCFSNPSVPESSCLTHLMTGIIIYSSQRLAPDPVGWTICRGTNPFSRSVVRLCMRTARESRSAKRTDREAVIYIKATKVVTHAGRNPKVPLLQMTSFATPVDFKHRLVNFFWMKGQGRFYTKDSHQISVGECSELRLLRKSRRRAWLELLVNIIDF